MKQVAIEGNVWYQSAYTFYIAFRKTPKTKSCSSLKKLFNGNQNVYTITRNYLLTQEQLYQYPKTTIPQLIKRLV